MYCYALHVLGQLIADPMDLILTFTFITLMRPNKRLNIKKPG